MYMRVRKSMVTFIVIIQCVLFLTHLFLYATWTFSNTGSVPAFWTKLVFALLSVSFIAASLLTFKYTNPIIRAFYRAAAVWVGLLTFLLFAALLSWVIFGLAALAGVTLNFHHVVRTLFAAGTLAGIYAVFNASWTRVTRATVQLANLPEAWRGRKAALISDLHLGPVRNRSFLRRMIAKILSEAPDAVFIAGDLYDGTAIDAHRAAEPLSTLTAPRGVYFVAGNHEQFGDDSKYPMRSRRQGYGSSPTRRLKSMVCRSWAFLTGKRPEWERSLPCCTPLASTATAQAFCSPMPPIILQLRKPRASPCSFQDTRIWDNLFRGAGWRGECTGNLCTA